jgi:hypothetical protein
MKKKQSWITSTGLIVGISSFSAFLAMDLIAVRPWQILLDFSFIFGFGFALSQEIIHAKK